MTIIRCLDGPAPTLKPAPIESQEGIEGTVFLFTAGNGGYGKAVDGKPTNRNFLARSVALFLAHGFNVAILGLSSDTSALDYSDCGNEKHLADVRAALEFVRTKSRAPIWLVGTSRRTISATDVAIGSTGDAGIAGLVLTSSVTAYKKQTQCHRKSSHAQASAY